MAERNLFQQAKEMIQSLTENQGTINDAEREATRQAIDAAYQEISGEQKSQLEQLEQELKDNNLLR